MADINPEDTKAYDEHQITTLARAANPGFNRHGLNGSTISALLAGYEPLKTIPGLMTGFARERACDQDGKIMTLD